MRMEQISKKQSKNLNLYYLNIKHYYNQKTIKNESISISVSHFFTACQQETVITTESGLQYEITLNGNGASPQVGDKVTVHYSGFLSDSAKTKFDSSLDRDQPFSFKLGKGQVIPGWDEGIALLKVGDKAIFHYSF